MDESAHLIIFHQRVPHIHSSRLQESEYHATAKDEFIDLREGSGGK